MNTLIGSPCDFAFAPPENHGSEEGELQIPLASHEPQQELDELRRQFLAALE